MVYAPDAAQRDEIGKAFGYRQDQTTGTWWGRCYGCGNPKASVGLLSHSCPVCGVITHAEARELHLSGQRHDMLPNPTCALGAVADPPQWLVEGLLLKNEPGFVVGDGGAWKTTTWLHVAGAVAGGYPVFGRLPVLRGGPVLFVSEEDGLGVLLNRLDAICVGHQWNPVLVKGGVHFHALDGATLDSSAWRKHIIRVIAELGIVYVVLDPYRELTAAAENSSDENRTNIRFLRDICRAGATPSVLHHFGKWADNKRAVDRIRGSSAIASAARVIWQQEASRQGVELRPLKLSRVELPDPLSLRVELESEGTEWGAALWAFDDEATTDQSVAEQFVLDRLDASPGPNSSGLKELAKARNQAQPTLAKISGRDVSEAIRTLAARGQIAFEKGSRGAHNWFRTDLAQPSGQAEQVRCPPCPQVAGRGETTPDHLAQSLIGMGKDEVVGERTGQGREQVII